MIEKKYLGLFCCHVRIRQIKGFCLIIEILMLEKLKNDLFQMLPHTNMILKFQYFIGLASGSPLKKS